MFHWYVEMSQKGLKTWLNIKNIILFLATNAVRLLQMLKHKLAELPNPPAEYLENLKNVKTNFQSHIFQDYMWQFKSKVHCETWTVLKQLQ